MRCTPSPTLLLALCSVTFAACGSSDRDGNGGSKPGNDAGFIVPDLGFIDAGNNNNTDGGGGTDGSTNNCNANPNNCVQNQLIGAFPGCMCLQVCATGFSWNAGANRCDPIGTPDGGTPDTGTPGPDGGTPDSGVIPDSGLPPPTACTTNANCMAGEECIDPMTANACAGAANCGCFQTCVPNQTTNTCGAGEACLWLWPGTRAFCVADLGGFTQAQPCTATFDPGGNRQGDDCSLNHFCLGATPTDITGVCSRLCQPGDNGICAASGNYVCVDAGANPNEVGLCLSPVPGFNDIGNTCTTNPNCMGNLCSQVLAGSCSYACGGLSQCPAQSVCLNAPQEGPICVSECTFGAAGDTFCSGRNPMTICETLGTAPNTVDVCIPRCTQDAECGNPPATCNTATGHCN
ncbi:MAG: hypothetical protein IPG45_06135 [Deltaproteobacteria bacterium]|nr:hypothetical protein [Deltaproteobacteria bacterium]